MSDDVDAYKNVSGTTLHINDTINMEVPVDGFVKFSDYPMLRESVDVRRFINMNLLVPDPSEGRKIGSDDSPKVRGQSLSTAQLTNDQVHEIIDETTRRISEKLSVLLSSQGPIASSGQLQDFQMDNMADDERVEIVQNVIENMRRPTEKFGDLSEEQGEVDMSHMVDKIKEMEAGENETEW